MGTRPLLNGPIDAEHVDENALLREEISDLREELETLRGEVREDRRQLVALLQSGRVVFGGIEAPASQQPSPSTPMPHNRDAWSAWKQQLPPACGRVIDALLVQPLTISQLRTICKIGYSTVTSALGILSRNGLIEKDGDRNRLKRL